MEFNQLERRRKYDRKNVKETDYLCYAMLDSSLFTFARTQRAIVLVRRSNLAFILFHFIHYFIIYCI